MGGTTAQAQVDKKPYKNQTAGWLGVVKLDHLGAQTGVSVEPYGTVWLSDEEATLTARAPKQAKDNPFVEQMFMFQDQNGVQVEKAMRPLVLIQDEREVPGEGADRFVPVGGESEEVVAAGQRDTEAVLGRNDDREVPTTAVEPTLVPSSSAAVPPSHATRTGPVDPHAPLPAEEDLAEDERHSSWVDNPERTEDPQPGALGGSNEPAPSPTGEDAAKEGSPTAEVKQPPAPQPPVQRAQSSVEPAAPDTKGQETVPSESAGVQQGAGSPSKQGGAAEEHAAHLESGEETGAAEQPTGQAPEGEYAAHEEVGSPDAPTQGGSS